MAEVRNLYPAETLILRGTPQVRYRVWMGAAALYFVASYPFQGVLYSWCGDYAQVVFVVLGIVGALAFLTLPVQPTQQYRRVTIAALCAVAGTMLLTLAVYQNLTVVRELLLLVVIGAAFRLMSSGNIEIMRAFIYVTVATLLLAFFAVAVFYTHAVDWTQWHVDYLNLAESNPLKTRQFNSDFDYYLPLWLGVIPYGSAREQGLGLTFVRQSFVFTEPSDLWYCVAAPFWLALADTRLPARGLCLTVMAVALALSFSVFGILVTAAAFLFAAGMVTGGRILVSGIAIAILGVVPFVPLYEWVSLLGGNKADEFSFYFQNVTVFSDLTLLGHVVSQKEQPLSYGFLTVLYRYGVVGFAVNLCVSAAIMWAAFRMLQDSHALRWRRFPLFLACFTSVALLVKGTTIVPSLAALSLGAALGYRQLYSGPLMRTPR